MSKLKKYLSYCSSDFLGGLFLILQLLRRDYVPYLFFMSWIWCRVKGVKTNGFVKFWGHPFIMRFPNSKISIGRDCIFVSNSYSNYRGISHKCIISTGEEGAVIKIGDNCGFSGCSIVANKNVTIGNNVTVGADTIIGDRDDHSDLYASEVKPVIIEDDVWIGMHCIILKGVRIGKNTIIGAGSIVTKDIPANCIAAGVPCKVIKLKSND